jgi:hypothetical protein
MPLIGKDLGFNSGDLWQFWYFPAIAADAAGFAFPIFRLPDVPMSRSARPSCYNLVITHH